MNRVLIVDDKAENRYLLRTLLQGNECAVEEAGHGVEALTLARQSPPDLVVSDLLMPVMDGYTLLRHWKADERLKTIPFIVYTATYTESKDERLALDLGADAFILKPAEPDAFVARLHQVLRRSRATERPAVRVPSGDPETLLKNYGDILIRKLEEKALQMEEANRALQEEVAERRQAEAEANRLRADTERARQALLTILEDQRNAQEALRTSEAGFRAMFEVAAIGVAQTDPGTGRWVRVNQKMCAITGYSAEELLERHINDLTHPDDRQRDWELFQKVIRGEAPDYRIEKRYVRKDGAVVWVNVNMTVIRDAAGQPMRTMATIEDITERREAEAKLKEQLDELQRWHDAMVGREARVLELKHEVNALLARLGEPARYPSAEEGA